MLSIKYCRLILEQFLARIWAPEYYSIILESKNTFHSYLLFDLKTVGQKSGRRVLIRHYLEKMESKEKSMNIFYLISKMSCNKSGSRRVPIQHYFEKIGIERKINEYLLFDQQNALQQIWQAESTNTALFDEKIGIERKINEYLLFDQQNVLQQIWQPESTNTALFHEKIGIERKINEYLLFDQQNVLSPATCVTYGFLIQIEGQEDEQRGGQGAAGQAAEGAAGRAAGGEEEQNDPDTEY